MEGKIKNIILFLCVLLLILAGGLAYYYRRQLVEFKSNPQKLVQDEVAAVVGRVGELMILPDGEQPTLATVTDPERLKDQPFFSRSKVGDKVLLYTNARKAVLYDPVAHKIVEVAPIIIGNQAATPAPALAPAPSPAELPKSNSKTNP